MKKLICLLFGHKMPSSVIETNYRKWRCERCGEEFEPQAVRGRFTHASLLLLLPVLTGCALFTRSVPENRTTINLPYGKVAIRTPKDVSIQNLQIYCDPVNKNVRVEAASIVSTNSPSVIAEAGAARVAELNELRALLKDAFEAGMKAAAGAP